MWRFLHRDFKLSCSLANELMLNWWLPPALDWGEKERHFCRSCLTIDCLSVRLVAYLPWLDERLEITFLTSAGLACWVQVCWRSDLTFVSSWAKRDIFCNGCSNFALWPYWSKISSPLSSDSTESSNEFSSTDSSDEFSSTDSSDKSDELSNYSRDPSSLLVAFY